MLRGPSDEALGAEMSAVAFQVSRLKSSSSSSSAQLNMRAGEVELVERDIVGGGMSCVGMKWCGMKRCVIQKLES